MDEQEHARLIRRHVTVGRGSVMNAGKGSKVGGCEYAWIRMTEGLLTFNCLTHQMIGRCK